MFIVLHRLNDGRRVGIDALGLEQHSTAELQFPRYAGTGQQSNYCLQLLVLELRVSSGQAQTQGVPQFVEKRLKS